MIRKKRRLKRNDYSQCGHIAWMPSKAIISHYSTGMVRIFYPCGTKRFISENWYNDVPVGSL